MTNKRIHDDNLYRTIGNNLFVINNSFKRYGVIGDKRRAICKGLYVVSFVVPDAGAGIILARIIRRKRNVKLWLKTKWISIKEWWYLW